MPDMSAEEELLVQECIYQDCKDAFLFEWERKKNLENNASVHLTVYSIILGIGLINANKIGELFKKAVSKNPILGWMIIVSICLFLYCIFRGLSKTIKAIQLQSYGTFPRPNQMRERMEHKNKTIYLKSLSKYFARQVDGNEKENNRKVKALNSSLLFIKTIIICTGIIIASLIALEIIGG